MTCLMGRALAGLGSQRYYEKFQDILLNLFSGPLFLLVYYYSTSSHCPDLSMDKTTHGAGR